MAYYNKEDLVKRGDISAVFEKYVYPSVDKDTKKQIQKAISKIPLAKIWTPTSERPPEEFEQVLIQLSWGGYELTQYIPPRINPKHKDGYWGESDSHDYDYFDVEAWAQLPKRYREK